MERLYAYVGSPAARARAEGTPEGAPIASREALAQWVDAHPEAVRDAATAVVDAGGTLRLAPRRSEHVACAAGGEVRFAGEIAFERGAAAVRWCSNQSSGYCPEPASHAPLRRALAALGVTRVPAFEPSCEWRRCVACAQINLVKEGDLTCACCDAALPEAWNFAGAPPSGRSSPG